MMVFRPASLLAPVLVLLGGAAQLRPQAPPPPPAPSPGGAAVLVAPTRLVFDNRKRSAEVNLTNAGTAKGDFRVSLVGMAMDDDGGCKELPLERVPGQVALQDLVRFAPKVVTLNPQESQAVRIQLRKPADLPPGEYRLYMVFRETPPPLPEPTAANQGAEPKGISIRLTSLFGVAIPLIIRHGETSATAAITGMVLEAGQGRLRFRLERTGNQSVHGDLQATYQPRSGKPQILAEANSLSVFTPNTLRNMVMPLDLAGAKGHLGPGRLRVTFTASQDQGGGLLAEAFLDLP